MEDILIFALWSYVVISFFVVLALLVLGFSKGARAKSKYFFDCLDLSKVINFLIIFPSVGELVGLLALLEYFGYAEACNQIFYQITIIGLSSIPLVGGALGVFLFLGIFPTVNLMLYLLAGSLGFGMRMGIKKFF